MSERIDFPEALNLIRMLEMFGNLSLGEIRSKRFSLEDVRDEERESYVREEHIREVYIDNEEIGILRFFISGDGNEGLEYVGENPCKNQAVALVYDLTAKKRLDKHNKVIFP